jgi:hypothetical protein
MPYKNYLLLLLALVLIAGCVDLKGVNKFALTSQKTLAQPLPYGYGDYCYDSCYVYDNSTAQTRYPCDCSLAINFDTVVVREGLRLSAYFSALAKLSGSTDIINVDTLGSAIAAGNYGKISVTASDVQIVSGVATAIQDLVTVNFKSKHIADNLHRYSGKIDTAIGFFIVHLNALDGWGQNLWTDVKTQLLTYRVYAAPSAERWAIDYAYMRELKELADRHVRMQKFIKLITAVREGYHQLAINADDVKSKTLKQQLLALVNNITFLSNTTNN